MAGLCECEARNNPYGVFYPQHHENPVSQEERNCPDGTGNCGACPGKNDATYQCRARRGVYLEGKMSFSVMLEQLSGGMIKSLGIFVLTLVFSLPLGLLVSFARMSKNSLLRTVTKAYISLMRGTPLMLQLLVVYFGPYYLFGMRIGGSYRFMAIIIGFALNYAAYFAEIYRSGIESMPVGQYEAATNEVITLVKDTSLSFSLAYAEMFTIAKQIAAAETTFIPFVVAAVFYFVFNLVVAVGMETIEKKLSYYQ